MKKIQTNFSLINYNLTRKSYWKRKKMNLQGFTLLEMLVSLSLFAVIMTISMGSILGVFEANRKSESLKTVLDNLNFTLEGMSREIRFGYNYDCGPAGAPLNCSTGDTQISFTTSDGRSVTYAKVSSGIQKSDNAVDGGTYEEVTAPEITITDLTFYTFGVGLDTKQPKVIIKVSGYAGTKTSSRTSFTIESMVSQRKLDS